MNPSDVPARFHALPFASPIPAIATRAAACYTPATHERTAAQKARAAQRGIPSPADAPANRLSIACAAAFLIALLGLPLLNYFFPDVMAVRVCGFTLTWFVLGVLFFPFVWVIAYVLIKRSIALEEAEVAESDTSPEATEETTA